MGIYQGRHFEPSLTDVDTVYAGVEDAALFRSTDGGLTWSELSGLRGHGTGPLWQPGAGGMRLHTILLDPSNPERIFIAISPPAPSAPMTADKPGCPSTGVSFPTRSPIRKAEVGHCVHHVAWTRPGPDVLFMQKHWDVMRSDDAGDSWYEISGNLPSDFGFVVDVHAHEPDTIYVVPIKSDSEHYPPEGKAAGLSQPFGRERMGSADQRSTPGDRYVNVLRDAMAGDTMDECGVYSGTTGGQVYVSPDGGDNWQTMVQDLPAVLSVEVQTLP